MVARIVRLGSARAAGEGTRIGTVRRPPRGVPKAEYAKQNWYDVWLPNLAPSAALMRATGIREGRTTWKMFERKFVAELSRPEASHLLDTLAALSHHASFSIGCYC